MQMKRFFEMKKDSVEYFGKEKLRVYYRYFYRKNEAYVYFLVTDKTGASVLDLNLEFNVNSIIEIFNKDTCTAYLNTYKDTNIMKYVLDKVKQELPSLKLITIPLKNLDNGIKITYIRKLSKDGFIPMNLINSNNIDSTNISRFEALTYYLKK